MMRKRSSATLLAVVALQASLAQALGLGEINLRSGLDQPLDAEIRLRGVGDLSAEQILAGLATPGDFERAGVERLFSLTEMRFAVEMSRAGEAVLRVTTERPVREPYLDFVVEVRWPSGRVLREYTVLLDLPTYTPAAVPTVSAPGARPAAARPASAQREPWTGSGDGYTVQRNDTLWGIASRSRPDGVSVQRMMVAIQRANPDAFIRGNMNLIRAGAVLRIPAEAESVSQAEANGEVASQTQDWRGDRSSEAAYEPEPAVSEPAAPASASSGGGYLKLTGDSAAAGVSAAGGEGAEGAGGGGAATELAAAQETLASKEREIAELQSRVTALEEQKETYERLVEVESQSLAEAQTAAEAPPTATVATPALPPPEPPAAEPGLLARLLGNTMALAAVLGVVFIGILAFLFKRQRSILTYQSMPEPTQRGAPRKKRDQEPAPLDEAFARKLPEPQPVRAAPAPAVVAAVAAAPASTSAGVGEPSDPLSEAEIYIAYGRHERAIEVLERALGVDESRSDVRLKLMEILAERDQQAAFLTHYDQLQSQGASAALADARALASRTGNSHWLQELDAPTGVQFDASAHAPPPTGAGNEFDEPAFARLDVEDHDTQFDTDLDLDAAFDKADQPAEDELDLELGELVLGGGSADADLDLQSPGALERSTDVASSNEFDLDLAEELEFGGSPETPEVEPAPVMPAVAAVAVDEEEDLGLLDGADEIETKLELARAYIDMGDIDGARDILDEVMNEGAQPQRDQASELLDRIRSS